MIKVVLILSLLFSASFVTSAVDFSELKIVSAEHKLLQYRENDTVKGPSADILKLLLQDEELVNNTRFMPWSRAFDTAKSQSNTLIYSLVRTKEREPNFHWITKVSEFVRAFVSLKSQPDNKASSFEQAKEKTIAVVRDSYSYNSLLSKGFVSNKNLYVVTSLDDGIHLLLNKKVQLLYTDPSVLRHYYASLHKNSDDYIDAPILKGSFKQSYIALNKESNPALVKALQRENARLIKHSNYQKLVDFKPLISDIDSKKKCESKAC